MRVLYITPDLADADVARRELTRRVGAIGLDPCASTGDARARIEAVAYDAFLIDAVLTGRDGLECASYLRSRCPVAAIVALTRSTDEGEEDLATAAGIDECVPKRPNWFAAVGDALRLVIARRRGVAAQETAGRADQGSRAAVVPAVLTGVLVGGGSAEQVTEGSPAPESEIAQLRSMVQRERRSRQEVEAELARVSAAGEAERRGWSETLQGIQQRQESQADRQGPHTALQQALADAEARHVRLLEERREDARRLDALGDQLAAQRAALEEAAATRARLEADLDGARRVRKELIAERDERASALAAAEARVGELIAAAAGAEESRDAAEGRARALGVELAESRTGRDKGLEEIERVQGEVDAAVAGRDAAERGLRDATGEADALRSRVGALNAELAEAQRTVAMLREAVGAREAGRRSEGCAGDEDMGGPASARDESWPDRLALVRGLGVASTALDGVVLSANGAIPAVVPGKPLPLVVDPRLPGSLLARRADDPDAPSHAPGLEIETCLRQADDRLVDVHGVGWPVVVGCDARLQWVLVDARGERRAGECGGAVERLGLVREIAGSLIASLDHGSGTPATLAPPVAEAVAELRQFLAFAATSAPRATVTNVADAIATAMPGLGALCGSGVSVGSDVATREVLVRADAVTLARLVILGVLAGRDALPAGGTITIAAGQRDEVVRTAERTTIRPCGVLRLTARGLGAKAPNGLETLRELAAGLGGRVEATHTPGRAATIEIALPLVITA